MEDPLPPVAGDAEPPPRRRWALALGILVAIGFVAVVVLSSRGALVPVGGAGGGQGAMAGSGAVSLATRDVYDRPLSLPGGRAGVVLFSQASGCADCVRFARAAAAAAARARGRARVIVVMVDATTTRPTVQAFASRVGRTAVRYVIDDRVGSLASALDASDFAQALVFDRRGRVVARPRVAPAPLAAAVRRAAAR